MGNDLNTMSLEESVQEPGTTVADPKYAHVPPIFVVGVWRSGTTLLYSLLNQHPDIRLFFESDLPVLWPMFQIPWSRKSWFEKWEYWNAGVSRHDLDLSQLSTPVKDLAQGFELAGRAYAQQIGKTRWGCKSPSYYDRLGYLGHAFPDARFVIIWRDPEEICSSVVRAATSGLFFRRPGAAHKAMLASKILKKECEKLVAMGAFVHQIHYRDLVENTEATMRGVCEFLQVRFTPEVTVLKKAERSAVFPGAHHEMAKSGKIISKRGPDNTLTPEMTNKIRRYKALWKEQSGDNWLLSQRFTELDAHKPGRWERAKDRAWITALRAWDIAPRFLFSVLPTPVWQVYRRLKYRDPGWVHRQLTSKPTTFHDR